MALLLLLVVFPLIVMSGAGYTAGGIGILASAARHLGSFIPKNNGKGQIK